MNVIRILALALALFVGLSAFPDSAEARRGIAIINTGEDIFEAGPLPDSLFTSLAPEDQAAARSQMAGWNAGYKCSIFGVFWIYIAMWDCKPVAFQGDSFDDQPEVAQAIEATYHGKYSAGFWKGTMRWVILGLGVVALVGTVLLGLGGKSGSTGEAEPEAPPPV